MESEDEEELFSKLNSKYILNYISSYVIDNNFKEKLFLYSKKFQQKFDIGLLGLKENYLKKLKFNTCLYIGPRKYKEDILSAKYINFLQKNKLNQEKFEKMLYDIYENKEVKDINEEDIDKIKENEILINYESPLFNMLLKTKNFGKIFTIHFSQDVIARFMYEEKYRNLFEKLNQMNINYTSICYNLENITKINYLKEFNLDFKKIKKLKIETDFEYGRFISTKAVDEITITNFFNFLFLIINNDNNLVYLNIKFKYCMVKSVVLENLNNLKKLKYLYLENINCSDDIFKVKLNGLKLFSIIKSVNIYLIEMSYEELKELQFKNNKISYIYFLQKVNLKNLNKLDLSGNEISDIDAIEKVNFVHLKELNLFHNNIIDINILEKVNFKELKELNLSFNKISNINVLEKVNFEHLYKLDLCRNNISDINILEKAKFKELKELNLSYNKISDINILGKVNFESLNKLDLSQNKISDIKILEKANFKELKELNLCWNKISDINILGKVNFKKLKELNLSCNNILDINVLEKINYKVFL